MVKIIIFLTKNINIFKFYTRIKNYENNVIFYEIYLFYSLINKETEREEGKV